MSVLALAVVLDVVFGELPGRLHPVVWMGGLLSRLERLAPAGEMPRLLFGLVVAVGLPALWATLAWVVGRRLPPVGIAAPGVGNTGL